MIAVDYLAFYQPSSFGEAAGRIEVVAPVTGHELKTRAELLKDEADHPRAREEYYQVQLGSLERLPQPIVADKWKRLAFLYTTGEYMHEAHTLNELVVRAEKRDVLWRSLRERAMDSQLYQARLPEPELPPDVLIALLGIKEAQSPFDTEDAHNEQDLDW